MASASLASFSAATRSFQPPLRTSRKSVSCRAARAGKAPETSKDVDSQSNIVGRPSTSAMPQCEVVKVDYNDIMNGGDAVMEAIAEAFGPNGLGLMAVVNVPGLVEKRDALLPLATTLANLPQQSLSALEDEKSHYSVGWSHGKEMLESGVPDTLKGSFYANPHTDRPSDDPAQIEQYPSNCRPNVWPREDLPALEHAFKDLGGLMLEIGAKLGERCDEYIRATALPGEEDAPSIVGEMRFAKGRLLHFFPGDEEEEAQQQPQQEEGEEENYSSWCGWHLDHGLLTAIVSGMYTDAVGNEVEDPDPDAGVHVQMRSGEVVRCELPKDTLAFQVGEVIQLWSGGRLAATPHCVKQAEGPGAGGLGCNYFVQFMNPHYCQQMFAPPSYEQGAKEWFGARWEQGIEYGDYVVRTHTKYSVEE